MRIRSLAYAATAAGAVVAAASMGVFAQGPDMKMAAPTKAIAVLIPTKSGALKGIDGTITFTKVEKGTRVVAKITGLPEGKHGFHIHEFGDASSPDGKAAGGHFNPKGMVHGDPSKTAPRHLGDLGNIVANKEGVAEYDMIDPDLPMSGANSIIGHGVVIHEKADDFGQPVGNAGGRLAVAVIGIAKGE